jgi:hypothetical protein
MRPPVVLVLVVLATLLIAQPRAASAAHNSSRHASAVLATEHIRLEDEQMHLGDEHTRLDDARLRREAGSDTELQRWVPLGTLCLGLLGGAIGLARYSSERRRTRALEVAQGVNENLLRIAEYRPGPGATARVIAALRNLDRLIAAGDGGATATVSRRGVTDTLDAIATDELLQLETPTDARLPVVFLDEWPSFQERVRSDDGLRDLVIARYTETLTAFASRHAVYARTARKDGRRFSADESLTGDEPLLFATAIEGYVRYAELIPDASARNQIANQLCEALNDNRRLTEQLFDPDRVPAAA